jgi:hypothetical protein
MQQHIMKDDDTHYIKKHIAANTDAASVSANTIFHFKMYASMFLQIIA